MGATAATRCDHFEGVANPAPLTSGCGECTALGERDWIALRVCLSCGHVGCCEDSRHAHALAHFQATGHPLIRPLDAGDRWTWCYLHNRYFEGLAAPSPSPASGRIARWLHRHVGWGRPRRSH
jgi:uncharacterized UBP type Zn finger protein